MKFAEGYKYVDKIDEHVLLCVINSKNSLCKVRNSILLTQSC